MISKTNLKKIQRSSVPTVNVNPLQALNHRVQVLERQHDILVKKIETMKHLVNNVDVLMEKVDMIERVMLKCGSRTWTDSDDFVNVPVPGPEPLSGSVNMTTLNSGYHIGNLPVSKEMTRQTLMDDYTSSKIDRVIKMTRPILNTTVMK